MGYTANMLKQLWSDPEVILPVASGLLGSLIGGFMAMWGASRQVTKQARLTKDAFIEAAQRRLEGIKIAIDAARQPSHYSASALALRRHLSELSEETPPSNAYWDGDRTLGIKIDLVDVEF
jgi:hypothetical protein